MASRKQDQGFGMTQLDSKSTSNNKSAGWPAVGCVYKMLCQYDLQCFCKDEWKNIVKSRCAKDSKW